MRRFLYSPLFSLALGCSDGDELELDCESVVYRTCDIRQANCQARVFDQMRCLRGDEDTEERPRAQVVSEAELREQFAEDLQDFELDPDVERTYRALAIIGLVHLDDTTVDSQVDFQVEGLLGFYSHLTKEIVIVDHGEPLDSELANTTLGHEYVHALQDIEFDLSRYREQTAFSYDSALASTSVTEGEATLYDGFQLAKLRGDEPATLDWLEYYTHFTDAANDYATEERSPLLVAAALFPYTYGPLGAAVNFESGAQGGLVRSRGRDLSTQSFMSRPVAEESYSPDGMISELALEKVRGRRSLGAESLGAWMLHSFALRLLGKPAAPDLALAWRGDALSAFYDAENDASELVWQIRWDSVTRAQAFVDEIGGAVAPNDGSLLAYADGDTSVLLASTLPEAGFDELLAALDVDTEAVVTRRSQTPSEPSAMSEALGRFRGHCFH